MCEKLKKQGNAQWLKSTKNKTLSKINQKNMKCFFFFEVDRDFKKMFKGVLFLKYISKI